MSWEEYDPDCPGCRPAMLSVKTGEPVPEDDPMMVAVLAVWERASLAERQAWHRLICGRSEDPADLRPFHNLSARMRDAARGVAR